MKEFMFIFIGADYQELGLSPEEIQNLMGKWFAWIDELKAKDLYIEGRPLFPVAKTLRGPSAVVTDGPFTETKDIVGGYFIVKASSLDEAAQLAQGFPDFHLGGSVEVREVMQM
ncbi:MAG TPA: YciI family protein [Saprospiraceae bacterium]|nr:hypothetical protein [Saprospiraceae bacterium]HPG06860.1 YciI family protein [Saprospiraceae bacterium]HPQ98533.1 YciI family protein [Saprospiraceae bacterium]HQU53164.1 YciI family protein [Saprospiraceae bacterium]HRV84352.1 YciI family protein [Saprospiraceae bacterium]